MEKIDPSTIDVIAIGRGLSFRRNTTLNESDEGDVSITVEQNWQDCLLGTATLDGVMFPVLLYPDGIGEVAFAFEVQDSNGNWEPYDLTKLVREA